MNLNTIKSRLRVPPCWAVMLALFAVLPARGADYPNAVLSQNPPVYFRLSETTVPAPPVTTAANLGSLAATGNGTYEGSQGFFRGFPGALADSDTAAQFDGSSQDVLVPYNAALNTSTFTIEGWLNAKSVAANCALSCGNFASPRSGWLIYQYSAAGQNGYEMRMYYNVGTGVAADAVGVTASVVGSYVHVVGTFDGTTARIYLNGLLAGTSTPTHTYVPGLSGPFSIGMRADAGFRWAGTADEVAYYNTALDANTIAAHYACATTNATLYPSMILASAPVVYYRLDEAGNPSAANSGTLLAAANGEFTSGTTPGVPGPRPASYPGLESGNNAVTVNGAGGNVAVPALNFNTTTLTISGWIKPSATENGYAGIVMCDAGSPLTYAGLNITPNGTGVGYTWNNDPNTYSWETTDSAYANPTIPALVPDEWSYVALVVHPDRAEIYLSASNNPANWASTTNFPPGGHALQTFGGATLIGSDAGAASGSFGGGIDEVAIFDRALGQGELYSQYAAAVGGLGPKIFGQTPSYSGSSGDQFILVVDAGGTPSLSYQWSKQGSGPLLGATSSAYTISNPLMTDSGTYSCQITNLYSPYSVTSAGIPVSIGQSLQPAIVTPPSGHTLYPGGTMSLSVEATGGGLRYQWSKGGTPISGATQSSYIIASVLTNNTGNYSVLITNSVGSIPAGPVTVTVLAPTNSYEAAVVADKPEAWFRLDESSGTTMFDSMGRHDGVYTNVSGAPVTFGAPGAIVGSSDTAVTFDGTSLSYGVVPFSPKLNATTFTIECWAKTSDTANVRSPVSSHSAIPQGYMLWTEPAGSWSGGVSQNGNNYYVGSATASDGIVAGQWKHVVMVYDTSLKVYINGQWDGVGYVNFERNVSAPFIVGALGGSSIANLFSGQVDEVAVYTNGLTLAQVQNHYSKAQFPNPIPPYFLVLPASQEVVSNSASSLALSGVADGPIPISYQWFKNGSAIAGATTTSLTLSQVDSNGGSYVLQATNVNGFTNTLPATVSVLPPTPSYVNVTNGLVLHLTFDGDYSDSSGRANNGTATGTGGASPSISAGRIGSGALHYVTHTTTGVPANLGPATVTESGYVTLGNPADLQFGSSLNFSVSYWVKLPAGYVNGDLPFLGSATGSYGNHGLTFAPAYTNGGWSFSYNGACQVYGPAASINDGNWHHLVHTVDRTGYAVSFVDGVQADSRLATGIGNINTAGPINVGQDPTGLYPEEGSADIDDLAVWRRSLSPYEAYSIYYAATNSNASFNVPGTVTLHVAQSGTNLVLTWNPGSTLGTLLQADTVTGPWTSAGAYAPTYQITPSAAKKFYRLSLSE